jgi:hypothetical protein
MYSDFKLFMFIELLEVVDLRLLFERSLLERCVTVREKWVFAAVKDVIVAILVTMQHVGS